MRLPAHEPNADSMAYAQHVLPFYYVINRT